MQSKGDVRRVKRRAVWPCFLAIFGAFVLMGTFATPARADSNFERGFEDQMGRILAYEAVNLGKHVLFQGVLGPANAYRHPPAYRGRAYGRHDRGRGPAHDHWRGYDRDDRHERYRHRVVHRHAKRSHRRQHRHDRHCKHDVSYHYHYH